MIQLAHMQIEAEQIQNLVEEQMADWKSQDPGFPWHIVAPLIIEIVQNHNDIILLFQQKGEEMLKEMELAVPPHVSKGDIIGRVNSLLVKVRSALKASE